MQCGPGYPLELLSHLTVPPECVACGHDSPQSEVQVRTGILKSFFGDPPSESTTLVLPCCSKCRWRVGVGRFTEILSIFLSVALLLPLLGHFEILQSSDLVYLALAFPLFMMSHAALKKLFPPIVNLKENKNAVFITFSRSDYSEKFRKLN
jgi:hypothetical protein